MNKYWHISKVHYVPEAAMQFLVISAAISTDLPVTIAMAMLFDKSDKLTR